MWSFRAPVSESGKPLPGLQFRKIPCQDAEMSKALYKCMAKATVCERQQVRRSLNWLASHRGILRVMPDALEFRDWRIPYAEIDVATVVATSHMFIPCYVLQVSSHGRYYQFGLNPGAFWQGELPFPVKRQQAKLGYSSWSLIIRLVLGLSLIYLAGKCVSQSF
jgi:hypothetical protein